MFSLFLLAVGLVVILSLPVFSAINSLSNTDYKIVGYLFFLYISSCLLFWFFLNRYLAIETWDRLITIQIQYTALCIGTTAAIIAFRNYQRKSGMLLSATFGSSWNYIYGQFVRNVDIINHKDKDVYILQISLMLDDQTLLQLFDYGQTPKIIKSYGMEHIKIPPPTAYLYKGHRVNLNDIFSCENIHDKKLLILTSEGPVIASNPSHLYKKIDHFENRIISYRNFCPYEQKNKEEIVAPMLNGHIIECQEKTEKWFMYIYINAQNEIIEIKFFNSQLNEFYLNKKLTQNIHDELINKRIEVTELVDMLQDPDKKMLPEGFYKFDTKISYCSFGDVSRHKNLNIIRVLHTPFLELTYQINKINNKQEIVIKNSN